MGKISSEGKYIEYLQSLNLQFRMKPEEFGYDNPVLILMDAVLSINRQYNTFVIPRLKYFKTKYSSLRSLERLAELIKNTGYANFVAVWNYNHPVRVEILDNLCRFFIDYKIKSDMKGDLSSMKKWAKEVDISKEAFLPISGIGFTTAQYIRKMLGADTIKPDVHIKKSILVGTGQKLSERKTVHFVENVAKQLGISATALDHAIWEYYSIKPS
jgi:hypothetical protein